MALGLVGEDCDGGPAEDSASNDDGWNGKGKDEGGALHTKPLTMTAVKMPTQKPTTA